MSAKAKSRITRPSRRLMLLFQMYLRWYVGRHFHALRIAHAERFPRVVNGPLIIYLNHPSWWDPLTCIMISQHFLPQAAHYAPMDEAALKRYRFFGKLGLFAVEPDTARGAVQFVRSSMEIVRTPDSVLWLTPEGHFVDVRRQPPAFKDGMGALLSRLGAATVVPLALEYTYWDERLPEILVNCGSPLSFPSSQGSSQDPSLAGALGSAQQELATLAMTRNHAHFQSILEGAAGIGAMYDLGQRLRSATQGKRYEPEHGSIQRP